MVCSVLPPRLVHSHEPRLEVGLPKFACIPVIVRSTATGREVMSEALVDSGAEKSLFDAELAGSLGLDLSQAPMGRLKGLGGSVDAVPTGELKLVLLFQRQLSVTVNVGFVPKLAEDFGNILGLDALAFVDFGLSHARKQVYFGLPR
jgi:hypothetical protein